MPSLKWIAPEGRPRVFPVLKRVLSIGRASSNDVSIPDGSVAALHAQLVFDGRDFHLADVEGGGDIWINGKKRRRSKVFHHDRLKLGDAELVFSIYDEGINPQDEPGAAERAELGGMRKLADFSRRLMEIRTVPEQLEALIDAVIEVTDADKGFVIFLKDGQPEVTVARNVAGANLGEGAEQLSDSIIQRVIDTQQPLIVSDALRDETFRTSASVMNLKLCSVMCAPLIARGQLLGLIYVGNDNVVSLFEADSLDVLTVFAGQAALILQNALLLDDMESDRDALAEKLEAQHFGDLIGSCVPLQEVFRKVDKIASTEISVLITGETGTGKELIARELHRRSDRNSGPLVVVNCGAIPENLMESELFGHVRGAFTGAIATRDGKFQQAHQGTLFLDEIGELPLNLQVKLLRALQDKSVTKVGAAKTEQVDIRVIAATHRDLQAAIAAGEFREDLYYRLNVVNLHLPPLRERGDDVVLIA
ncbi:MAG: sigma 54-interacting transcriptional regulator, partial [Polyangiales bacterium]